MYDNNKITESDVALALKQQGTILEKNGKELADNKKLAIHRLLQSIYRLDYQCLNKPLKWKDSLGEHTGYYHPMDLIHFMIKHMDIPSRSKLYQKLSLCKLAVPVLFQNEGKKYMNISLRHVKTAWIKAGHIVEGNVTNAPVALLSMIRCGKQSNNDVSKSMLENDLFDFKRDANLGSCGFFSRHSLSSNNGTREVAKGIVEGMRYEGINRSNQDKFPASFGLLNLRGDALQNIDIAATVASTSDILFMFCGGDIIENDCYKTLFQETNKKLCLNRDGVKQIKMIVVLFPKEAPCDVEKNLTMFKDICENVTWENVSDNYQKLLGSISDKVRKYLSMSEEAFCTLTDRLRNENKESSTVNIIKRTEHINDSLLKMMDKIKNADEDLRLDLRTQLFPLQSTRKDYAQTQREENRSTHIDRQNQLTNKLIEIRKKRFEMIKDGLPEIMSAFVKELLNAETIDQKLMIVCNIQYALDDWCSEHLFDKRKEYIESVGKLTALKEKENEMLQGIENVENNSKEKETEKCENLAKLLLDISIGIENIFREISEIHDTTKTNEGYLIEELIECNRKLPEVAAKLLMKGVSLELMDGDGLFVPTGWLEEVLKSLEKCFQKFFGVRESPKMFVLTVLGNQGTGKSTLLNTMFGVQFPVSAGRCTKGAFIQLIPIFIENFPYHGLLVIDTQGLGAPEYREDNTHDNEIATFVLGISDLAIINVRGENPMYMENFLQISITALMRMSLVEFHPSVVFVHQNCDPTAKVKNMDERQTFMKIMDNAVSAAAKLIKKQDQFSCFRDVVDLSLEDDKNDFVYFPQFLEGHPSMSLPSGKYSQSCFDLTSHILNKMEAHFKQFNDLQTLTSFAKKVKLVWNGVLEENFVLSLINSAEIQVKYDLDNCKSNWKVKMESYMEDVVEKLSGTIEADFKAKEPTHNLLSRIKDRIRTESLSINDTQKEIFADHIKKQTSHAKIYKNWEQKCINQMDCVREDIMGDCQRRLSDLYNHEKNAAKWKDELQQSKYNLQECARKNAIELLDRKKKDEKPEFTIEEIEDKFNKFWSSVKESFFSKKAPTFKADDVNECFTKEITEKYSDVTGFKKVFERFGFRLKNKFNIEWVETSHVEFIGKGFFKLVKETIGIKDFEFLKNIEDLMTSLKSEILSEVVDLCDIGGFLKIKFKVNSTIFNCGSFVKQYLAKAEEMLTEAHNRSSQKNIYNLTDTFKVLFSCFAAQIAIPKFQEAQQSFIDYMDISTKLDSERENIKQLFTLILK